jgi:archaellum component FlaC
MKKCGFGESNHIDNVNKTLKLILEEIKLMHQTMKDISKKLDKISNDTYRIP